MLCKRTNKVFLYREYLTLAELRDEWNTTDEHIRYLIENAHLKVYLRPSLVFYVREKGKKDIVYEPIPINFPDLCRLLHDKSIILKKADKPISATYDDIVVKSIDRCKTEAEHPDLSNGEYPLILYSDNWTCFEFRGVRFTFGRTQGAALKYLYNKLRQGNPVVGTKELLDAVGAQCHHLNNLFHNKPMWKELITFPERGYCRLNLPNGVKIQHYQPSLFDDFE